MNFIDVAWKLFEIEKLSFFDRFKCLNFGIFFSLRNRCFVNSCPICFRSNKTAIFCIKLDSIHAAATLLFQPSNQVQIKHVELNNVKLKTDSSTQTTHRSNAPLTSEEKVIWRLRSRICDSSLRSSSDGGSTTLSQITVRNQKVPIKVVTQSPGLISPKRVPDPLLNRRVVPVPRKNLINSNNPACASVPLSPTKSFRLPADLPSSLNEKESRSSVNVDLARTGMPNDKPTALSKVVAIATSVPTRARSNENKVKESNGFGEEPTLLTAG